MLSALAHFFEQGRWDLPIETGAETQSLDLEDMHAVAVALWLSGFLFHFERNPAEVARVASDLIELAKRHSFAHHLAAGAVLRGWAVHRFR